MTPEDQTQIAKSFSDSFEEFELDINLPMNEFELLEKGMFATVMEDKWNVFVIDNYMYWTHSWTDDCIFKIKLNRRKDFVNLERGLVTRNKKQFVSDNIERDKTLFLELLQVYLDRDDIYVNPMFQLETVKQILSKFTPIDNYINSIGRGNTVSLTNKIYDDLLKYNKDYCEVIGWSNLKKAIQNRKDDEELMMLYIQNKQTNEAVTYYLDMEGKELLGQIVVNRK